MHVGKPPWRHSSGRCIICGTPINVRSPIVTEPHYYGNVCSMYCIVVVLQYTLWCLVSPKVSAWVGTNGHLLTLQYTCNLVC